MMEVVVTSGKEDVTRHVTEHRKGVLVPKEAVYCEVKIYYEIFFFLSCLVIKLKNLRKMICKYYFFEDLVLLIFFFLVYLLYFNLR